MLESAHAFVLLVSQAGLFIKPEGEQQQQRQQQGSSSNSISSSSSGSGSDSSSSSGSSSSKAAAAAAAAIAAAVLEAATNPAQSMDPCFTVQAKRRLSRRRLSCRRWAMVLL